MFVMPRIAACWLALFLSLSTLGPAQAQKPVPPDAAVPELKVPRCDDFELSGDGQAPAWKQAEWTSMPLRPGSAHDYQTRFKLLYSRTGLYVFFDGADKQLTATKTEDYLDLWTEDVFECFFWPDEKHPVYFEYEISPLGYELPILVPNFGGQFLGWRPWMYSGSRKTRKAVSTRGGEAKSKAAIAGWTAEVFIPFELLKPLANVPPKSGTQWRANFYRMDYDGGQQASWDWARVGESFHDFQHFGRLFFE
jgi:hypothetical protein